MTSGSSALEAFLESEMASWEAAGLRRSLSDDATARAGVDFTSNDYLGLAQAPELISAARAALERYGVGSGASRLLGGGSAAHEEAERMAADWLACEATLLFPSGFQANQGLICALAGRQDAVFSDELNHASLIDAARLSRARVFVHAHLDLEELERQLAQAKHARRRLVLTEGVFSMDGDRAPLADLYQLCEEHEAWLIVDEAHSAGLLGPEGAGAWAELGRGDAPHLAARVVTGGKALGAAGAFVAGAGALREHLIQHARAFVYTTAPSPALAAALSAAVTLVRQDDARRSVALAHARGLADALGLEAPAAAIVPYVVGTSGAALQLESHLRRAGLHVRAVRPPTVPDGTSRLRLVCHATNTAAELDELARAIQTEAPERMRASTGRALRASSAPSSQRALFVVGTDTGIGKTVVSALLLAAARNLGPSAYWKPVQTGDDSDTETVRQLAEARPHELLRPAWQLSLPASPHEAAAAEGKHIRPREIEEGLSGLLRTMPDTRFVVELAGGLLVPYQAGERDGVLYTQADWLARARPPCVLVARSELGTLNHTLLTLEALRARHLEPRALFLVGEEHPSNRETLRHACTLAHVFEIPRFATLGAEALAAWLEANDLGPLFS